MVDRRSLLKNSVFTLAGCAAAGVHAGAEESQPLEHSASFSVVYPGVWKATIGTPESYTPGVFLLFGISSRTSQ